MKKIISNIPNNKKKSDIPQPPAVPSDFRCEPKSYTFGNILLGLIIVLCIIMLYIFASTIQKHSLNIWFKQKFYNLILEKKKTQTIRLWRKKPNFQNGEEFECFFGFNHKKLKAEIKEIITKNFDEITLEEVNQDGFVSKEELLFNLKNFYPNFNNKINLYLIKFEVKND